MKTRANAQSANLFESSIVYSNKRRPLWYQRAIRKEQLLVVEEVGKVVKVIDSTVLKKAGINREMVGGVAVASEFVGPTARELTCLMQINPGNQRSAEVGEVAKSFASLLNRGSSQE